MTYVKIVGCLCTRDSTAQGAKSIIVITITNLRFVHCAMCNIALIAKTLCNYSPKINYVNLVNQIIVNNLEQ